MTPHGADIQAVRRDTAARLIAGRWREITGGSTTRDEDRRTLVACSAGADSTALLLALAASGARLHVAHVVHDLRSAEETAAECARVRGLSEALGLPFTEAAVTVRERPGNTEANARRERYRALERLAWEAGCPFVATGHHADDQMETMLMGMLRGAGVGGLAGMPASRALGGRGITLVRPMLRVSRADGERLCEAAGLSWATDPTNADISRFRAGLRHGPLRDLASMRPRASERASELAEHLRGVDELLRGLASDALESAEHSEDGFRWARPDLADQHPAVIAAALRAAYTRLHGGRHGDRLPARSVREVVEAILGEPKGERRFVWKAAEVKVSARAVEIRRLGS